MSYNASTRLTLLGAQGVAIAVFCAWCGEHGFRVDINTVDSVGTMWMVCPACGRMTGVSDDPPRGIVVRPGAPPGVPETEAEWLRAASRNPVFASLERPEEDIYSKEDGQPFRDEG